MFRRSCFAFKTFRASDEKVTMRDLLCCGVFILLLMIFSLEASPISDAKKHYNKEIRKGAKHLPTGVSGGSLPHHSPRSSDTATTFIDVRDYGADPSGLTDSTDAVLKAVADLLSSENKSDRKMASNIVDMGGITLDLAGGVYLMSEPLVIPTYVGNIHFIDGTLRASSDFRSDWHLVHIGNTTCTPDAQNSCNEFISFTDMMFDSNFNSAGVRQSLLSAY